MKNTRVPTSLRIDKEQLRALKELSRKTLIPMSSIIRRGIDMALSDLEARQEAMERGLQDAES